MMVSTCKCRHNNWAIALCLLCRRVEIWKNVDAREAKCAVPGIPYHSERSRTPFRPEPFRTVGNGGYIMLYNIQQCYITTASVTGVSPGLGTPSAAPSSVGSRIIHASEPWLSKCRTVSNGVERVSNECRSLCRRDYTLRACRMSKVMSKSVERVSNECRSGVEPIVLAELCSAALSLV